MAISDSHAATIVEVRAYFGFDGFACDPDEITRALGIAPGDAGRRGETRLVARARAICRLANEWGIASRSDSKDINDHLRELLARLGGVAGRAREEFGSPSFSVLWKGNYLYAGSGPNYDADVIAGIASHQAMLCQDVYQVDMDREAGEGRWG